MSTRDHRPGRGQPGSRADKITDNEMRFLVALRGGGARRPSQMIEADPSFSGRSPQGLHQTAASLVHKGMVEKGHDSIGVCYKITQAGRKAVSDRGLI